MTSVTKVAGRAFAGAAVSLAIVSLTQAATVAVNNEVLTIQDPSASAPGMLYVVTGGQSSSLKVDTDGFMFCTNVGSVVQSPVTLKFGHEDRSFSTPHPWTFPTATDVLSVAYNGGELKVNLDGGGVQPSTLVCHGSGLVGNTASGLTDGIFDNGLDSPTVENYNHLVNWTSPGFDWTQPDWTQVPADACTTGASAQVIEDTACAAVTGVQPGVPDATRSPIAWTATNGINFSYLFRVDAALGPQPNGGVAEFAVPQLGQAIDGIEGAGTARVKVRDAFEGGDVASVGYLGSGGHYCLLTELPATLDSNVCSGHTTYALSGPMAFEITLGDPPLGIGPTSTFYVAAVRPVVGGHQNLDTPVVGMSVFMEPAVTAEGGDRFSGDNIVFGFMPTSQGFPWMSGQ